MKPGLKSPEPLRLTARQARDAGYYDALWRQERLGAASLRLPPDEVLVQEDLGRSLAYVLGLLGDLTGRRVLELGCGLGVYTVMLARRGAHVTAIDVSLESIALTSDRARANGVADRVDARQMGAEVLQFDAYCFDLVVGFGILHHVDLEAIGPAVRSVLLPGGRAVFREPLGENPLLEFVRDHVPYPHKARSPNENPLTYAEIRQVGTHFERTHLREFYLLSMLSRYLGRESALLWRVDAWLLRRLPVLRRFCRYVVVEYRA
jgi:2-polyprenyl-3-methyl-5-hydroxy-6-metoxy-1,4-benzoquinol methylase